MDISGGKPMREVTISGRAGYRVSIYTGELEQGFPDRWSSLHLYHAYPGDSLVLLDFQYAYAVACYLPEADPVYRYTYAYQKEENWTKYDGCLTPASYRTESLVFDKECYFRINLKKRDESRIDTHLHSLEGILSFVSAAPEREGDTVPKSFFREEIDQTIGEVRNITEAKEFRGMVFFLCTDSHYVVNGTWQDTYRNMMACSMALHPDGFIHLGDLTDGMVSKEVTTDYVNAMMGDMERLGGSLYFILGNHDSNYFAANKEPFTREEEYDLYFQNRVPGVFAADRTILSYYKDMDRIKTRFIFLDSFDYQEQIRYGFSDKELLWFRETLKDTPKAYDVMLFSHVPPLTEIHFWSDQIRNGEAMVQAAELFHEERSGRVLAWIHGHNHGEMVYRKHKFPIISIGCNKCESFPGKKPPGCESYMRTPGQVTQDLWDVLIVSPAQQNALTLIRFGAGENRRIVIPCKTSESMV
jgi:3',5'-cyclic AMP phosphodiesterase CpdA